MKWREWLIFPLVFPLAIGVMVAEWVAGKLIDWAQQ